MCISSPVSETDRAARASLSFLRNVNGRGVSVIRIGSLAIDGGGRAGPMRAMISSRDGGVRLPDLRSTLGLPMGKRESVCPNHIWRLERSSAIGLLRFLADDSKDISGDSSSRPRDGSVQGDSGVTLEVNTSVDDAGS
jgi:hypothetical protein